MCRRVIKDSKDRNQNREQTVFSLITECKKLLNDLSSTCVTQVQARAADFGMETACTDLKLCPVSTTKGFICSACKTAMKLDYDLLNSSATQQQVLDSIKKLVCDNLPFGEATCDGKVDASGSQIYQTFLEHKSEKICQLIDLCPKPDLDCNECTKAFEKFQTKKSSKISSSCNSTPRTSKFALIFRKRKETTAFFWQAFSKNTFSLKLGD